MDGNDEGYLVRVFVIPPPTGRFHFGGGEAQTFVEVDWFRDDPDPGPFERINYGTPGGKAQIAEVIKGKRYYDAAKDYLVLHPVHPIVIRATAR